MGGLGLWCLVPLSTIWWRSVSLVVETRVPGENLRPYQLLVGWMISDDKIM